MHPDAFFIDRDRRFPTDIESAPQFAVNSGPVHSRLEREHFVQLLSRGKLEGHFSRSGWRVLRALPVHRFSLRDVDQVKQEVLEYLKMPQDIQTRLAKMFASSGS